MWSVKPESKYREDNILCGQGTCETCRYLADVWDMQGSGHRMTWDGSWKDGKPEEFPKGGWWEDNWRKQQIAIIANTKRKQEAKQQIQINLGAGLKHVLWTISLTENYNLTKLQQKLDKLVYEDKYQMGQSLAAIEFHSENHPMGGNLHIHIVVINHGKMKPSVQAKSIAKFFEIADNFVDYQPYRKSEDFQNAINYVLGNKSEEKQEYVDKDRQWREDNDLPQLTCSLPAAIYAKYVKPQLWFT